MADGFQSVHLELRSSIEVVDLVQVVAEHIGRRVGLDEESLHWVTVALRESVINAVNHGNDNNPDKRVFIDFSVTPNGQSRDLVVSVRDQGPGFDPSQISDPLAPENVLKTSGRGIFLIRQFMDDVVIQRASAGGMEVRMLKHI